MEKLHNKVGEDCSKKLNEAEFNAVSTWCWHSNAHAKDKLCALEIFLVQTQEIALGKFSTDKLKAIDNTLQELKKVIESGRDVDEHINPGSDALTIKQTFLYGSPQISIHYENCTPAVRDNFSLQELIPEIKNKLAERAKKIKYKDNPPIKKLSKEEAMKFAAALSRDMAY